MTDLPEDVRRRLAEVFGDDVRSSGDERGDGGSSDERDPDGGGTAERDRWLRDNRPPHHG